jgi:DNA-binding SARP family transcriptional activator
MEFKILGPLEVHEGGRRLVCTGSKQRLLLGVLLLHANEVVSADLLIEALWGASPPETARKALQMHVSQLRDLLEPRRARGEGRVLLTRPPGYELQLEEGELDLQRFERTASEARAAAKAGRVEEAALGMRDALALWRGPPLSDLSFESFVQADISRLEELRIAAIEDRIDADIALGRHADVVPELEGLAAQHPRHERIRAQLMLALYRSGRQAEALEVYRDTRRVLVDDLGIEPGKELRELEEAMLRQDPGLEQGVTADGAAPEQSRGVFVGRERELEILRAGLEDSLAGHGGLYLLVGEPGIGKSRLAEELANHARSRRAQVLVGRCWEAGGAPAYWPWIQSLRAYIHDADSDALQAQLGMGAADLAQLLPELRELFPKLPRTVAPESEGARVRLFDAVTAFLKRAASSRPLVLIIDDLHAADEPSLLLLRYLSRELPDSCLLVIAAFRDVDPTVREPLAPTLAELAREPATHQISLAGLSHTDVADYIELAASSAPPRQLVERIQHETDGNPLFVTEVVQLLNAEGSGAEAGSEVRIPASVRAVIGERLRRLSERCRGVLVLASVLGREFGLDAISRLSDLSRDELLERLDEAMTEHVVGGGPGSPGRLRFAHALIRDALYDDLTPVRRVQLHRRAGEALEVAYAAHLEPHLAELAHHFFIAAPAGSAPKAVEHARAAGDRAVRLFAYEEAVRLYGMALDALGLDEASTEASRCDVLLALADAQGRAGDGPGAKSTFLAAADIGRSAGLPGQLARAAAGYGGRFVWARAASDERLVPLLEDGLSALGEGDSVLRVQLLSRLAAALRSEPSRARRERLRDQAVEAARNIGDPATLAYALDAGLAATQGLRDGQEELAEAEEIIFLAESVGDRERAFDGHEHAFWVAWMHGDPVRRTAALTSMTGLARQLRQPAQLWLATASEAALALAQGRFGQAEDLMERAAGIGEHAQSWNAAATRSLQLFVLRREQGRLEEVEPELRDAELPSPLAQRAVRAQLWALLGRAEEAEAILDEVIGHDLSEWHVDEEWLFSVCLLAEAATILENQERAASLYHVLVPHRSLNAVSVAEGGGDSASRALGILATLLGHLEDATAHFEEALAMNRRMGARPWVAHTEHEYALMLIERGESGDRERASDLLTSAVASYREFGMRAWADRAAPLLE